MATRKEVEYAREVLKAIKDTQRHDKTKTILITCVDKSQVVNIEKDLGDLEKATFGSLHPHMIDFETGFRLFTKTVTKIEVVDVGKTILSKG